MPALERFDTFLAKVVTEGIVVPKKPQVLYSDYGMGLTWVCKYSGGVQEIIVEADFPDEDWYGLVIRFWHNRCYHVYAGVDWFPDWVVEVLRDCKRAE